MQTGLGKFAKEQLTIFVHRDVVANYSQSSMVWRPRVWDDCFQISKAHTLSKLSQNLYHNAGPSGDELGAHYESLAKAQISVSFDNTFENGVLAFLNKYDAKCVR